MGIKVEKGIGNLARLIKAYIYPLKYIKAQFDTFTYNKREQIKYNSQIIYLRKRLNDLYDPLLRRIYIVNNLGIPINYLYNKSEETTENTQYIYNKSEETSSTVYYVYNKGEEQTDIEDFTIYVPNSVFYDDSEFEKNVNIYKFADKIYNVVKY